MTCSAQDTQATLTPRSIASLPTLLSSCHFRASTDRPLARIVLLPYYLISPDALIAGKVAESADGHCRHMYHPTRQCGFARTLFSQASGPPTPSSCVSLCRSAGACHAALLPHANDMCQPWGIAVPQIYTACRVHFDRAERTADPIPRSHARRLRLEARWMRVMFAMRRDGHHTTYHRYSSTSTSVAAGVLGSGPSACLLGITLGGHLFTCVALGRECLPGFRRSTPHGSFLQLSWAVVGEVVWGTCQRRGPSLSAFAPLVSQRNPAAGGAIGLVLFLNIFAGRHVRKSFVWGVRTGGFRGDTRGGGDLGALDDWG